MCIAHGVHHETSGVWSLITSRDAFASNLRLQVNSSSSYLLVLLVRDKERSLLEGLRLHVLHVQYDSECIYSTHYGDGRSNNCHVVKTCGTLNDYADSTGYWANTFKCR